MSWDGWTANLETPLQGGRCGIAGQDGNPWSVKNCGNDFDAAECKKVADAIRAQDTSIATTGVQFCKKKWAMVRMEPEVLVIKGKEDDNKEQTMTVTLSKQAVVFGANPNSQVQANYVRDQVERLKKNLEDAGY